MWRAASALRILTQTLEHPLFPHSILVFISFAFRAVLLDFPTGESAKLGSNALIYFRSSPLDNDVYGFRAWTYLEIDVAPKTLQSVVVDPNQIGFGLHPGRNEIVSVDRRRGLRWRRWCFGNRKLEIRRDASFYLDDDRLLGGEESAHRVFVRETTHIRPIYLEKNKDEG